MKKTIFAVDDEQDILDIIKINLNYNNFSVETFNSGEEVLSQMNKGILPDLLILDIMMEGMDGYELCKKIRANSLTANIPIIFLSAKSEEFDKVLGLELGADDYLTKPFSVKELTSRVKAVLRRSTQSTVNTSENESKNNVLNYKGLYLYPDKYKVTVDGKSVKLTKTEFEMLHLFLKHPGKIFSRDNIIDSIRGNDVYVVDRTIDVHIMNLRKKINTYKNIVTTFSGVGYGFKEDEDK